jgi:hypothetical protein
MNVQEILSRLERNEGHFPKVAIREAIAHRNEIFPPLLEVLEAVAVILNLSQATGIA